MGKNRIFTYSEVIFVVFLILLAVFNFIDVIFDYEAEGGFTPHVIVEILIIIISVIALIWLLMIFIQRRNDTEEVEKELAEAQQKISASRERQHQANSAYFEVVNAQFVEWGLTDSEMGVARLMLKGLSFEEIADVRETKEKTVRQQATSIYRKAKVAGRHEFAAWFFEDFLNS